MIIEQRHIKLRTIYEVARRRRNLFLLSINYIFVSTVCLLVFVLTDPTFKGVPKVDYEKVMQRGRSTKGVITQIGIEYNVTVNLGHPSIIHYRYKADGIDVESKFKTLAPEEMRHLSVGDSVEIKYLGEESIIATMEQFEFLPPIFYAMLAPFFLAGLAIAVFIYYESRREILLYKHGKIVNAEILSVIYNKPFLIFNRAERSRINYQYKDSGGRTHLGEKTTKDVALYNTLKSGDTIKIFVSPTDETKSTLIPKLEIARNNWRID